MQALVLPEGAVFRGTTASGERQRPGAVVAWTASGAGPQPEPTAPAVGHSQGSASVQWLGILETSLLGCSPVGTVLEPLEKNMGAPLWSR